MIEYLIKKSSTYRLLESERNFLRESLKIEYERNVRSYVEQAAHPRPARMVVDNAMTETAIEEALTGSQSHPIVKAISALITAKVVELSDVATDRPRAPIVIGDRTVPGYSNDERLHDAGGSTHMAELLARIQELTKPKADAQKAA